MAKSKAAAKSTSAKSAKKSSAKKPPPKPASKAASKAAPKASPKAEGARPRGPVELREIRVGELRPGPWQYRKVFDQKALDELTESVKKHGVHTPISARRASNGQGFEIIYGERRWRAAKAAGLEQLHVLVRDLSDDDAYDMALDENVQRKDPHPLDESDALVEMRRRHSLTIEGLAARVGKGLPYVAARLALEHLGEEGRKAMMLGVIGIEAARAIAMIRDPKIQAEAVEDITRDRDTEDPVSVREAKDTVHTRFLLRLATAPFSTSDKTLPGGGCETCPKRSGNQTVLFETASADLCLDRACWETKVDATWDRIVGEAKAKGTKIIGPEEAKTLFPYGERVGDPQWCDLHEPQYYLEQKSWAVVLGISRERELVKRGGLYYVRSPKGSIHRVAKRADLMRVAKDHPRVTDPETLRPTEPVKGEKGSKGSEGSKTKGAKVQPGEEWTEASYEVRARMSVIAVERVLASREYASMLGVLLGDMYNEIDDINDGSSDDGDDEGESRFATALGFKSAKALLDANERNEIEVNERIAALFAIRFWHADASALKEVAERHGISMAEMLEAARAEIEAEKSAQKSARKAKGGATPKADEPDEDDGDGQPGDGSEEE